jgi:Leucine-rich repeat (LRR) protein
VTLDVLHCEANQLATLDLSHNPALAVLICDENQLTTLDVSNNPLLEVLSCRYNFFPDRSAIMGLDESRLKEFVFDPQRGL